MLKKKFIAILTACVLSAASIISFSPLTKVCAAASVTDDFESSING